MSSTCTNDPVPSLLQKHVQVLKEKQNSKRLVIVIIFCCNKFLMIRGKGLSVFTLFQTLDETSCSYSSWLCSKSPCQWLDLLIFFILVYFNFVQIWTVNIASIYTRFTKICYENWGRRTRHWNSLYVPLLKCWYLLIQHQIECCLQLGKMLLFFFTASESSRTRLPSVLDPQDSVSLCCFL